MNFSLMCEANRLFNTLVSSEVHLCLCGESCVVDPSQRLDGSPFLFLLHVVLIILVNSFDVFTAVLPLFFSK